MLKCDVLFSAQRCQVQQEDSRVWQQLRDSAHFWMKIPKTKFKTEYFLTIINQNQT